MKVSAGGNMQIEVINQKKEVEAIKTPEITEEDIKEIKKEDKKEDKKSSFRIPSFIPEAIVSMPFNLIAGIRNRKKWLLTDEQKKELGQYCGAIINARMPSMLDKYPLEAQLIAGLVFVAMEKMADSDKTPLREEKQPNVMPEQKPIEHIDVELKKGVDDWVMNERGEMVRKNDEHSKKLDTKKHKESGKSDSKTTDRKRNNQRGKSRNSNAKSK
ncbi:MAG: hypothetical protein ACE5ES_01825 [Candidatus Nanoarchaeia archaeon]